MRKFFKRFWKYVSNPPLPFLLGAWAVTTAMIATALTLVFIGYTGWVSYLVYAMAATTLTYTAYTFVRLAPTLKMWVSDRLKKWKFTRAFAENYTFRSLVLAAASFIVNVGFVLFNTAFAFLTNDAWYGALAGYYFLLGTLRAGVFYFDNKTKGRADYARVRIKNYRLCGIALFLLEIAMSVAVALMVLLQKPTKYSEISAIVFAAYSVYKITFAIWNIFKARRAKNWQIQAFRNLGLADAAISLLSLQTTLISTFSQEEGSMLLLNGLTGAFVCLFTLGMGVLMIVQANKKLKETEENERE